MRNKNEEYTCISWALFDHYTALLSQKAVPAYLKTKHLLHLLN